MSRSVEPLIVGGVIGDVLDMFTPATEFTVHYGTKQVTNGCDIKPSAAADKPHLQILGPPLSSSLYTLVMVDPDAPNPSEPRLRELLHWIVVDIPHGHDATKGRELVAYMGPRPTIGIHRYILALFKQEGAMGGGSQLPDGRANFSTRQFAAQNRLGLPVAAVYFNSQKEPAMKKR
ncbi:protein MOTHER of FT and TFL1-like [Durio zibethinus]|uniref:Protein MOTHER of FT and TFL1-like n=1 Tax=Durio zibethinus TaxID=66656 RepID=A0A6P5WZR9_DURZI|nr:protein MOTHER of FT and TFL1-like [Durio zibethinus]